MMDLKFRITFKGQEKTTEVLPTPTKYPKWEFSKMTVSLQKKVETVKLELLQNEEVIASK